MSEKITVKSAFRSYDAEFVNDFTASLKKELDAGGFAVVDSEVFRIYGARFSGLLQGKDFIVIEANELNKTIDKSKEIIEVLIEKGFRRGQKLIAIGGGVVEDITAFTASILYRGVPWVFFPTTLLAMADSCIGGKTSINLGDKKNLIGNFYPPEHVYIDLSFTESLPVGDIKSGIGEMMHFYLYSASPYFKKIVKNHGKIIADRKLLAEYVKESLSIKKSVIEIDEFDRGERNKFNYGHTFGHALESATGYGVKHGLAVTLGMDIANFVSFKLGFMPEKTFLGLHNALLVNFPKLDFGAIDLGAYFIALSKDKKNEGSNIGCILAEGTGKLIKVQVPANEEFKNLIRKYFKTP